MNDVPERASVNLYHDETRKLWQEAEASVRSGSGSSEEMTVEEAFQEVVSFYLQYVDDVEELLEDLSDTADDVADRGDHWPDLDGAAYGGSYEGR